MIVSSEFFHEMLQVLLATDHKVIEAFDAQGLDESLGVGVHVRGQRTDSLHLGTLRLEHRIEVVRELGIVIDDEVSDRQFPVVHRHRSVACLLRDPLPVRTGGRVRDDNAAGGDMDEEQKVEIDDAVGGDLRVTSQISINFEGSPEEIAERLFRRDRRSGSLLEDFQGVAAP